MFSKSSTDRVLRKPGRARPRGLFLPALVALALSGTASAASPHYSLFTTFPDAKTLPTGERQPQAIIAGQDGYLFGVASAGGYNGMGGLFSVRPTGIADTMSDFSTASWYLGWTIPPELPSSNYAPLSLLPDGTVLGVSNEGGVFSTDAAGQPSGVAFVQSITGAGHWMHVFYPATGDISQPQSISLGSDGNIYGLAIGATWSAGGTLISRANLFRMTLGGVVTNLFNFDTIPTNFALGADCNMYVTLPKGTIPPGGGLTPSSGDVIYKVTPDGTGSVVHVLDPVVEGQGIDHLVADSQGNLYGSALGGGTRGDGDGTVFRVAAATGDFTLLHDFSSFTSESQQGYWPNSLVAGSDGNLYGVAREGGGTAQNGTFFRITPNESYTVLHTFGNVQADGANARSLIQGGPRTFYGVVDGGPTAWGGIFKLVVPIQDDVNGSGRSSVVMDAVGKLSIGSPTSISSNPVPSGYDPPTNISSNSAVPSGYHLSAIGDLNGDGMADILWTTPANALYIWFGSATGFVASLQGTYASGWTLVGVGDVDGDGKDDVIWANASTHQFAYWLMNGVRRAAARIITTTAGYYPAALGDFDGNGKLDVLWTSDKHDLYLWTGTGTSFSSKRISSYPARWRIAGRGDVDGDGHDDLIWSTSDNSQWGYWLMNGASVRETEAFNRPAWLAGYTIAASADYDGDGLADLLWSNGTTTHIWSNLGTCVSGECTFSSGLTSTIPSGESVFNSALPSNRQIRP